MAYRNLYCNQFTNVYTHYYNEERNYDTRSRTDDLEISPNI